MSEQRNLILAIALSISILLGFNYFYEAPKQAKILEQAAASLPASATASTTSGVSSPASAAVDTASSIAIMPKLMPRETVVAMPDRVKINAPKVFGSINLQGGRIDDLSLRDYHETPDEKSAQIHLLTPEQSAGAYYADFGWASADTTILLPTSETIWSTTSTELSVQHPVVLTWDNGQGLSFEKTITIDDQYMFTVTDRVTNKGQQAFHLNGYGQISRVGTPTTGGFMILHEGPIGVIGGKLQELDYSKIAEKRVQSAETTGGWLGITDKYWLVALIPSQKETVNTSFKAVTLLGAEGAQRQDVYQTEIVGASQKLEPGKTVTSVQNLFSGAKKLALLDDYETKLGFQKFDLAVDFGWFYFLTKPLFYVMDYLHKLLGNFGLAILALTILIKLALFPLANKSYRSMSRMKQVQPKIEALKGRFGDDKMRMNQELMELYKREKINPVSGCLPMLVQAPIFFCLYKVLFVTLEMRHAPFYGWIHDLSAPDPTSIFNLFGLLPFTPPGFLMIGAWPLLMGISMVIQQRMNPQPADPIQAKMFMIMPVFFTVLLASFPAGLVIYWAWNNILTMLQQGWIMRLEAQRESVKVGA